MGSEVTCSEGKLTPLQELYLRPNAKHGRQEERNLAMAKGERVEKMDTENVSIQQPAVLTDENSVKDVINVGRQPEEDFGNGNHAETDTAEVTEAKDNSSDVQNTVTAESAEQVSEDAKASSATEDTNNVPAERKPEVQVPPVEIKGGVYSDKTDIVSYPDKPERLPNITLGREPRSAYFKLSKGIVLKLKSAEEREGCWKYEQVNENGEDKICFTPFKAGEYEIPVEYNDGKKLLFHLTVNPDPWSLWTVEEIDEKLKVFSSDQERIDSNHKDVIAKEYPGLKVVGASHRGRSHERSGTFRDDDMGVWADEENGNYVFIVSDGAGSCRFSREGARIAISFIKEKLESNKARIEEAWAKSKIAENRDCPIGMTLTQLARLAKDKLSAYVAENKEAHPDWKVKDFSGTLLVAALKREKDGALQLVTLSIGDGAIAWYLGGGKHGLMCCPDSGEFGGGTRFLTTPEVWKAMSESKTNEDMTRAYKEFCNRRVFCKRFSPEEAESFQLFLMSDGVSDPWFETDARLENGEEWRRFAEETLYGDGENQAKLKPCDSVDVMAEKLFAWLEFKIAGNHDDRTIIAVYSAEDAKNDVQSGKKEA